MPIPVLGAEIAAELVAELAAEVATEPELEEAVAGVPPGTSMSVYLVPVL